MSEGGSSLNSDFNRPIPEWVPQPIKDRLIKPDDNREQLVQNVKGELVRNLRIELNNPDIDSEKIKSFESTLAKSIVEASEELHIPVPGVGLTESWRSNEINQKQGRKRTRDAAVSPHSYQIDFHPQRLKELLGLSPFVQEIEIDLVVRHELLHFWDMIHLQKDQEIAADKLRIVKRERPDIYDDVKETLINTEMRAKKMELKVLSEVETTTVKQFLYKSLIILLNKLEISKREKERLKFGVDY